MTADRPPRATAPRVVPFPQRSRHGYIARHAALMLQLSPRSAEGHLGAQLRIQANTMRRRGIAEHIINREINALEQAIRTAMWRLTFGLRGPGDCA